MCLTDKPGAPWEPGWRKVIMTLPVYAIRLRERGQLTLPQAVRKSLDLSAGVVLTLVQIDNVLLLSRRESEIPELSQQFSVLMQEAGVSLAELLEGLDEERELIWKERLQ